MTDSASEHTVLPPAAKPVITKIRELMSTGRAAEALASLSELDEFEGPNPKIVRLTKATILIDLADDLNDIDCARRGISLIEQIDGNGLPASARRAYWYNLGNGYGAVYYLKKIPRSIQRARDDDFRRAKDCYRKAMALVGTSPDSHASLYTNYGILLRTVGRHVEEMEAYDEVLKAAPDFAMALWHKARGLRWYATLVERPTKRSALLEAWRLLKRSLEVGLEPARRVKAEKEFAELERILNQPKISAHNHTKHVAHSDTEEKYIKFCVENRLYLHQCPVESHDACQDPLSVRFPTRQKDEFLELRLDPLAVIKQEYILARFLLFSYRFETPELSFVDRGTFLPSTREAKGQIYLGMLNLSLRVAYAVLDKIGYFLNSFCRLGEREDRIYLTENLFLRNGALRPELAKYDGLQLAALFDLVCEFSKNQPLSALKELRHKLEHRCVTVRRAERSQDGSSATRADAFGNAAIHDVGDAELYENALSLLRVVRAAIFYLFYFVRVALDPIRKRLGSRAK